MFVCGRLFKQCRNDRFFEYVVKLTKKAMKSQRIQMRRHLGFWDPLIYKEVIEKGS